MLQEKFFLINFTKFDFGWGSVPDSTGELTALCRTQAARIGEGAARLAPTFQTSMLSGF